MYTLLHANSTDISRSTSEDFLERWEPWYLKWTPGVRGLPSNEYSKIFRELAMRSDVSLEQNPVRLIRERLTELTRSRTDLSKSYREMLNQIINTRTSIAQPIIAKWPALLGPYTKGYQQLIADGILEEINAEIQSSPAYQTLVTHQNSLTVIENEQLVLDRKITQLNKMLHLRRLATLKEQLVTLGSSTDINTYNEFLQCEELPFTNASSQR